MWKLFFLLLMATGSVFSAACNTTVPEVSLRFGNTFNGPTFCGKGITEVETVNGPLKTADTIFKNPLTVNGGLVSNKTKFKKSLYINGTASLNAVSVSHLKINGTLVAHDCDIKSLNIASDHITLENSKIHNMTIRNDESFHPAVIWLKGKSFVTGNITFTGQKNGTVMIGPNVKIKGKVINGTIKKE